MSTSDARILLVDRGRRVIEVLMKGVKVSFPLNPIPEQLYQQLTALADGPGTPHEIVHRLWRSSVSKPTTSTVDEMRPFKVNSVLKVACLTLLDSEIEQCIDDLESRLLGLQGRRFEATLEERLQLYRELHFDDGRIDRFRLGVVEMVGEATFENIRHDPRVTLLFNWYDESLSHYMSCQVNVIAEIVGRRDPFYRYMRVVRTLFARRFIETRHPEYVCAYKLWVAEALDKTLVQRDMFYSPTLQP